MDRSEGVVYPDSNNSEQSWVSEEQSIEPVETPEPNPPSVKEAKNDDRCMPEDPEPELIFSFVQYKRKIATKI